MLQDKYQAAIRFAGEKHKGQLVPGTHSNYLLHLSNVAMEILVAYANGPSFDVETAVTLALLHDTLEDTQTTPGELTEIFGERITEGVQALTKNSSISDKLEKMNDSLNRILVSYPEVGMVKIADRITNLQKPPHFWKADKIQKYGLEAQHIYDKLKGFNKYLDERLSSKINDYQTFWVK